MITVLTEPVPSATQHYAGRVKETIRPLLRKLDGKAALQKPAYGGHFAVTRSLVDGLRKAGIPFVYNPRSLSDCTPNVIALAGLNTVQQGIELRKDGVIKSLAAGPNVVVSPLDAPETIGSRYIDRYVVNSEWVSAIYAHEMPSLRSKLVIWPAGVDEEFWRPARQQKDRRQFLFYSKRPDRNLFDRCVQIAREEGCSVTVVEYGNYTIEEYRRLLSEHAVLVHFTPSESQGISLAEAWSMNVPSLVWNPGKFISHEREFASSSAPLLSDATGSFFRDEGEFRALVRDCISGRSSFNPRSWILENLTDQIAALHLLRLLGLKE